MEGRRLSATAPRTRRGDQRCPARAGMCVACKVRSPTRRVRLFSLRVTDQPLPTAKPPPHFMAALGLSAGFMAFVAWDQSHWWSRKEDYSFGWLVPLFTA